DEQRNLYKALVDAYEANKTILESYGELAILKRQREDDDDQEGPSAGSDQGSKRQREGREHASASTPSEQATGSAGRSTTGTQSRQLSASESAFAEEPVQTTCQMEEPSHPVFEIGAKDQPIVQTSQHPEWFSQPRRPPTLDRDWNKTLPAAQGNAQSWISALAKQTDARSSFNELLDTPIDFSNFIMNWLGVDTLTPELLAGPTYKLMRGGSCNSLTELEYHLEEVYKATTDQLDWDNPEGQQYPHNLLQPLPLIPDNRGHRVIPFKHFINNDLEYLWGGASSHKYTTSVTKTKAEDYGHIKWIEDLFYGFAINRDSALDVYSKRRIIAITELKIVEWHNYKHLDWISRVEDLQLGVESYQKRLNLTKPDTYRSDLKRREAYTAYSNPRGFIYQDKDKKNILMRIDEHHKFSDGTLNDVRNALDDRLKGIQMQVHSTFHVSNLKKCLSDEPLAISLDEVHIDDKLRFVEEPVEVMDREVNRLNQIRIPIIKVRWNSRRGPEFTWEREDQFRKKYPQLFTANAPSTNAAS
nr:putative reverse transcriptase domain-containing protein [Tanacetum cinerariifolium]